MSPHACTDHGVTIRKKDRAEAGLSLLAAAGIEATLEEQDPGTVFSALTPGARQYLLQVQPQDLPHAHRVLYRQEPAEKPEKNWEFREKGSRTQRKSGLRLLMLGGALVSVSLAIAAATYVFASPLHLLMPLGAGIAGLLLMIKGWMQVQA